MDTLCYIWMLQCIVPFYLLYYAAVLLQFTYYDQYYAQQYELSSVYYIIYTSFHE